MSTDSAHLWPRYEGPADLPRVEAVPLNERGLPSSTYEILERAAERWPDRPALTVLPSADRWRHGVRRTFAELRDDVHRLAHLFAAHGADGADAIGILSPNTALLPAVMLAAQTAGIAAPVNPALPLDQIVRLFQLGGARILVAAGPELDEDIWAGAREIATRLDVTALFALRPTASNGRGPALEPLPGRHIAYLEDAAAQTPPPPAAEPPKAGDLASLFHTGGTTGAPKLAAHTQANEVIDAWSIAANALLDQDAVIFAALPLFHVNALVVTLLAPLLRGQHVVWAGPLGYREPELYSNIWKIVEHFRLSTLSAVPTVYSVLAKCPVDADISSLRFAVVGASALPPGVRTAFCDHTGVELCEGYGLTEATCASARSFLGPDRRPGSVGQRLPYQQVRTIRIDDDGTWHNLPPGQTGILAVKGPTVFAGYVTGREADAPVLDTLGTVRDGWLNTGDLARIDRDGFIHLTGRAKDLIIRGGHNIDPAVIEDALLEHPDVAAAGAVGRPDPHAGEVPVAYVTLHPEAYATPAELMDHARSLIHEAAAVPKEIVVLDSLPLTDVGKPTKVPLRIRALKHTVLAELAAAGAPMEPAHVQCTLENNRFHVHIPRPADPDAAKRATAHLDRYAFAWDYSEPPGPA